MTCTVLLSPPMTPRRRRHVVGDDPVGTLRFQFLLGVRQHVLRFGREADDEGGRFFVSCAIVFRMSGFSVSVRVGGPPADDFLILLRWARSTRQSATAAANIAISAGSAAFTASSISAAVTITDDADVDAAGIGKRDGTGDKRHAGAEAGGGDSEFVALLSR